MRKRPSTGVRGWVVRVAGTHHYRDASPVDESTEASGASPHAARGFRRLSRTTKQRPPARCRRLRLFGAGNRPLIGRGELPPLSPAAQLSLSATNRAAQWSGSTDGRAWLVSSRGSLKLAVVLRHPRPMRGVDHWFRHVLSGSAPFAPSSVLQAFRWPAGSSGSRKSLPPVGPAAPAGPTRLP